MFWLSFAASSPDYNDDSHVPKAVDADVPGKDEAFNGGDATKGDIHTALFAHDIVSVQ